MKKFLFVVIGMCLCLSGCSSSDQTSTGYDSTYWGMSKNDVLQVISYVEHYDETETEITFEDARILNMRDYNIVSLSTFDPFNGGYQIPKTTYRFENDALCEIEVEYVYESQQDTKWYDDMVEWLEISYEKNFVAPIEEQDAMRYGGTSFLINDGKTKIMITTIEWKTIIDDYGSLSISYKKN